MRARKHICVAHADPDRADLLSQTVRTDHENVLRFWIPTLKVMRGRVAARDDVIEIAAEPEGLQPPQVVESRGGRVVRREEDVPSRPAESVERLFRVRHHLRPAIEDSVHVEDRDRHRRKRLSARRDARATEDVVERRPADARYDDLFFDEVLKRMTDLVGMYCCAMRSEV